MALLLKVPKLTFAQAGPKELHEVGLGGAELLGTIKKNSWDPLHGDIKGLHGVIQR